MHPKVSPSLSPLLQQYFVSVWTTIAEHSSVHLREDCQHRSAGYGVAAVPQHCVGGAPEDCGSCQITGNEGGESEKQEKNCQGGWVASEKHVIFGFCILPSCLLTVLSFVFGDSGKPTQLLLFQSRSLLRVIVLMTRFILLHSNA